MEKGYPTTYEGQFRGELTYKPVQGNRNTQKNPCSHRENVQTSYRHHPWSGSIAGFWHCGNNSTAVPLCRPFYSTLPFWFVPNFAVLHLS